MQERLNEEIRRRERVIRIFPNDESALRLIGACSPSTTRTGRNGGIWTWTNSRSGLPPAPPPAMATTLLPSPAETIRHPTNQREFTANFGLDCASLPDLLTFEQPIHFKAEGYFAPICLEVLGRLPLRPVAPFLDGFRWRPGIRSTYRYFAVSRLGNGRGCHVFGHVPASMRPTDPGWAGRCQSPSHNEHLP